MQSIIFLMLLLALMPVASRIDRQQKQTSWKRLAFLTSSTLALVGLYLFVTPSKTPWFLERADTDDERTEIWVTTDFAGESGPDLGLVQSFTAFWETYYFPMKSPGPGGQVWLVSDRDRQRLPDGQTALTGAYWKRENLEACGKGTFVFFLDPWLLDSANTGQGFKYLGEYISHEVAHSLTPQSRLRQYGCLLAGGDQVVTAYRFSRVFKRSFEDHADWWQGAYFASLKHESTPVTLYLLGARAYRHSVVSSRTVQPVLATAYALVWLLETWDEAWLQRELQDEYAAVMLACYIEPRACEEALTTAQAEEAEAWFETYFGLSRAEVDSSLHTRRAAYESFHYAARSAVKQSLKIVHNDRLNR